MGKIKLTEKQKGIVTKLNDELYTADYLEEWLNRNDNVYINAAAALSAMGATGFYRAVLAMEQAEILLEESGDPVEPPAESQEVIAPAETPAESKEPAAPAKQPKRRSNKKTEVKKDENDSI